MNKGICILPMVPVREKPADKSQMINQLLFGDVVHIKDRFKNWLFVITSHDDYAGWIDEKQISTLPDIFFDQIEKEEPVFLTEKYTEANGENGNKRSLIMGSRLPGFENNVFRIGEFSFKLPENVSVMHGKQTPQVVVETARNYLGSPYLWGGRSFFGNDCSGFTQIVYRICGHKLLRDASQQAEQGKLISFVEEAEAADLAFFENEEGSIVHVGILLNNHEIIHSSGQVRIDTIDHEGIFNETSKKYSHKLRFIKRVLV